MTVVISAIIIFILLSLTAIFALTVPLEEKHNMCDEESVEIDSVLVKLVQVSKSVPAAVDII